MKIDAFTHVSPKRYIERVTKSPHYRAGGAPPWTFPELYDMDLRLAVMDEFGIDQQVLTLASPPVETVIADPGAAAELAALANDEIASLAARHPTRFIPVGNLALNNLSAALRETERCLNQLGMQGMLIYSNAQRRPIDLPEFFPFYQLMAEAGRPIWLHPFRGLDYADYAGEAETKYSVAFVFGWIFETSLAMTRLVMGGVFDQFPNLKFVVHHAGALIPLLEKRIDSIYSPSRDKPFTYRMRGNGALAELKRRPIDYYRMFYTDTVGHGSMPAVMAALNFFGPSQILFGTDTPFDFKCGREFIPLHTGVVDHIPVCPADRAAIYAGNIQRLLAH